jgi:hypothetical protein
MSNALIPKQTFTINWLSSVFGQERPFGVEAIFSHRVKKLYNSAARQQTGKEGYP